MPTSTKVKNLNINELTEAQYDAAVQGGVIGANELSVLTDVEYVEPSDLATVATSGSYNDLTNKPTIPTVGDGTITITQGGVTKGTFTTNQSGDTTIDVDAGGGSGLPDQTGNAGKFLTTDGTDASWGNSVGTILPLVGNLYELGGLIKQWSIVWARNIGYHSVPSGTGPLAVIGVNTTITLAAADWSSNTQTVSVTGMTATGIVMVSPAPADQSAYTSAGILCTAQAANSLTFSCDTVPAGDLSVNIVML